MKVCQPPPPSPLPQPPPPGLEPVVRICRSNPGRGTGRTAGRPSGTSGSGRPRTRRPVHRSLGTVGRKSSNLLCLEFRHIQPALLSHSALEPNMNRVHRGKTPPPPKKQWGPSPSCWPATPTPRGVAHSSDPSSFVEWGKRLRSGVARYLDVSFGAAHSLGPGHHRTLVHNEGAQTSLRWVRGSFGYMRLDV